MIYWDRQLGPTPEDAAAVGKILLDVVIVEGRLSCNCILNPCASSRDIEGDVRARLVEMSGQIMEFKEECGMCNRSYEHTQFVCQPGAQTIGSRTIISYSRTRCE